MSQHVTTHRSAISTSGPSIHFFRICLPHGIGYRKFENPWPWQISFVSIAKTSYRIYLRVDVKRCQSQKFYSKHENHLESLRIIENPETAEFRRLDSTLGHLGDGFLCLKLQTARSHSTRPSCLQRLWRGDVNLFRNFWLHCWLQPWRCRWYKWPARLCKFCCCTDFLSVLKIHSRAFPSKTSELLLLPKHCSIAGWPPCSVGSVSPDGIGAAGPK